MYYINFKEYEDNHENMCNRDNLEPLYCRKTDHAFDLTTFDTPTVCDYCSKLLKGFISQGFKCDACETSVHKGCMSSVGICVKHSKKLVQPGCNQNLSEFYWFAGSMDGNEASSLLKDRKIGTYLLRIRSPDSSNSKETIYCLSLK